LNIQIEKLHSQLKIFYLNDIYKLQIAKLMHQFKHGCLPSVFNFLILKYFHHSVFLINHVRDHPWRITCSLHTFNWRNLVQNVVSHFNDEIICLIHQYWLVGMYTNWLGKDSLRKSLNV